MTPTSPISLDDCFFYHTMDIPGVGLVRGQWDLRSSVDQYLGGIPLAGRRVLEIGPASGFLTFEMERRGADVVGCELPSGGRWDFVPYANVDVKEYLRNRDELHRRLVNAFWFAHAAFASRSRVVYTPVYDLPSEVGTVDIATFSAVLLHLREPFRALETVLARVEHSVVITEMLPWMLMPERIRAEVAPRPEVPESPRGTHGVLSPEATELIAVQPPILGFAPDPDMHQPKETWWQITPSVLRRFLGVLGFRVTSLVHHFQPHDPAYQWTKGEGPRSGITWHPYFTLVGERS